MNENHPLPTRLRLAGRPRPLHCALALGAGVALAGIGALPAGAAITPTAGRATVDGSAAEWQPGDDVGPLLSNDPSGTEMARLSLRYDCAEETLYALMEAGPDVRFLTADPGEFYLRLGDDAKLVKGSDGDDGEAPDAAWIDATGGTAAGIEMSASVAPGTLSDLRAHGKIPDESADGYQTIDLLPRNVDLDTGCLVDPAAVDPASVDPNAAARGSDPPGQADPDDDVAAAGLARTGVALPILVATGLGLVALGVVLRTRPWRSARRT